MGVAIVALSGMLTGANFLYANMWREFGWHRNFFRVMLLLCIAASIAYVRIGKVMLADRAEKTWSLLAAFSGTAALVFPFLAICLGTEPVSVAVVMSSSIIFCSVAGGMVSSRGQGSAGLTLSLVGVSLVLGGFLVAKSSLLAFISGFSLCCIRMCALKLKETNKETNASEVIGYVGLMASAFILILLQPHIGILEDMPLSTEPVFGPRWVVPEILLLIISIMAVTHSSSDESFNRGWAFAIPLTIVTFVGQIILTDLTKSTQSIEASIIVLLGSAALALAERIFTENAPPNDVSKDGKTNDVSTDNARPNSDAQTPVSESKKRKPDNDTSASESSKKQKSERTLVSNLWPLGGSAGISAGLSVGAASRDCEFFARGFCRAAGQCRLKHTGLDLDRPWKKELVESAKRRGINLTMKSFDALGGLNHMGTANTIMQRSVNRCTDDNDINSLIIQEVGYTRGRSARPHVA